MQWLLGLGDCGFPVTKLVFTETASKFAVKCGKGDLLNENGVLGRRWYEGFLKRHQKVRLRTAQNLTKSRASVTEESIKAWFAEVTSYLNNNHYMNVLEDPRRIFNFDESAFVLRPKSEKVLVRRNEKCVFNFINNSEKECLTVLLGANAAGDLAPPMTVFAYERVPRSVIDSMPENWAVGKTKKGWMTSEAFYEFMANIFLPWILKQKIERPVG